MNRSLRRAKWWLCGLLAVCTTSGVAGHSAAAGGSPAELTGLLHNEDCTNFFYHQDFPAGTAGQIADRYVDVLADAGVTVLMCNTNARRTNYCRKSQLTVHDNRIFSSFLGAQSSRVPRIAHPL